MRRIPLAVLAVSVAALGFLLAGASGKHVVDSAGVCHGHNKACTRPTTTTSPTAPVTTTTTTTTPPPSSGAIAGLGTVRWGSSMASATNLDEFSLISQGCQDPPPGTPARRVIYSSGAQVWDGSCTVADKATARANGWLLHTASGAEIPYFEGGNGLLVDPGNVSFQNDLKSRLFNYLTLHPQTTGFYLDNFEFDIRNFSANGSISYPIYSEGGQLLYSSYVDYRAAQLLFIANVGAVLKSAGYFVSVNVGHFLSGDNGSNDGTLAKQFIGMFYPSVTAVEIEFWDSCRFSWCSVAQWNGWQSVESYANGLGLGFVPIDDVESSDLRKTRFFRGCFLLDWNGIDPSQTVQGAGAEMLRSPSSTDNWNAEMAKNLGLPLSAKQQVATDVWRRDFTNGYVIVNPTGAPVTVGSDAIPAVDAVLHQN